MAAPTITALPSAPSRVGDPTHFYSESILFLEAQDDFATECTSLGSYLNAVKFNPDDWGNLSAIPSGGSPVNITHFVNTPPTPPASSGFTLANDIDALLSSVSSFVSDANAVAAYIDGFNDAAGTTSDPARPTIHAVSSSPLRTDSPSTFGEKALSFYGSARSFSLSLQEMAEYVTAYLGGAYDWALISDAITETDDWGLIVA